MGSVSWNSSSSSRVYRARRRRRTSQPCSGSRSTARASTSRSWNSSSPRVRRAAASRSVNCASSQASRRTTSSDEPGRECRSRARARRRSRPGRRRPSTRRASCPCDPWLRFARRCSHGEQAQLLVLVGRAQRAASCQAARSSDLLERACRRDRGSARSRSASSVEQRPAPARARGSSGGGSGSGPMRSATRSQLALHANASVRSTGRVVSALSASSSARSSAGSSSSSSTKRVHRSSNASCDAMSSSTSMPRWEPGFDGVLGEEPLRERVQRRHRGAVELLEGELAARRRDGSSVAARRLLERPADPVAQLGRGLLGERDRGDLAHGHVAARDQRDHPVDQRLGLARSRARFDEERLVERLDDRGARRRGPRRDRGSSAGPLDGHAPRPSVARRRRRCRRARAPARSVRRSRAAPAHRAFACHSR